MNEPLFEEEEAEEVNLSYNDTFTFSVYDIHALFKVSKIALSIVLPNSLWRWKREYKEKSKNDRENRNLLPYSDQVSLTIVSKRILIMTWGVDKLSVLKIKILYAREETVKYKILN